MENMEKKKRNKVVKDHLGNEYESMTAMLEHWGVPSSTYYKKMYRGTPLEEILTSKRNASRCGLALDGPPYHDHLGNEYPTVTEMCAHYNIKPMVFYQRLFSLGWNIELALTTPVKKRAVVKAMDPVDHVGNRYENVAAMLKAYGVNKQTFYTRKSKGWTLEECLTGQKNKRPRNYSKGPVKDHLGNTFGSKKLMAEYWGIHPDLFLNRQKQKMSLEESLTKPYLVKKYENNEVKDHLGNVFPLFTDMLDYYGVSHSVFHFRRRSGWTLEECLTGKGHTRSVEIKRLRVLNDNLIGNKALSGFQSNKIRQNLILNKLKEDGGLLMKDVKVFSSNRSVFDHLGKEYATLVEMLNKYNVNISTYWTKREAGWSLEQTLLNRKPEKLVKADDETKRKFKTLTDHLGKEYEGLSELAKSYGFKRGALIRRLDAGWSMEDALTTPAWDWVPKSIIDAKPELKELKDVKVEEVDAIITTPIKEEDKVKEVLSGKVKLAGRTGPIAKAENQGESTKTEKEDFRELEKVEKSPLKAVTLIFGTFDKYGNIAEQSRVTISDEAYGYYKAYIEEQAKACDLGIKEEIADGSFSDEKSLVMLTIHAPKKGLFKSPVAVTFPILDYELKSI